MVSQPGHRRALLGPPGRGCVPERRAAYRVSRIDRLADATLSTPGLGSCAQTGWWDGFVRLVDATSRQRGFGDYYGYALVAEGKAEIYVEVDLKPWDVAAVQDPGGGSGGAAHRPQWAAGHLQRDGRRPPMAACTRTRSGSWRGHRARHDPPRPTPPGRGRGGIAMRIAPFPALRASPPFAARVAAPPYDVVTREEAARLAAGNPLSFLRVARAEIDLPPDTDPHHPTGLRAGSREPRPARGRGRPCPRGPAVGLSVPGGGGGARAVGPGCVRPRQRLRARGDPQARDHAARQGGRPDASHAGSPAPTPSPSCSCIDDTRRDRSTRSRRDGSGRHSSTSGARGVRHTVWARPRARGPGSQAFRAVGRAYVADGHHRSASASRAARQLRRGEADRPTDDAGADWFLAVLFPASQLRILPYHRLVRDLGGRTPARSWNAWAAGRAQRPPTGPHRRIGARLASTWIGAGIAWRCRPRRSTPATRSAP